MGFTRVRLISKTLPMRALGSIARRYRSTKRQAPKDGHGAVEVPQKAAREPAEDFDPHYAASAAT